MVKLLKQLINPSLRYEIREAKARLKELLSRICIWRWRLANLENGFDGRFNIVYFGRDSRQSLAEALLKTEGKVAISSNVSYASKSTVYVSELYLPGALKIPWYLRAIVTLGRSIGDIAAEYDGELRRKLRKQRSKFNMLKAVDETDIERADKEFLKPYAVARYGEEAAHIGRDELSRIVQKAGRLDWLMQDGTAVACHLGCEVIRSGKRYWSTVRFGYPESVFTDAKRLREINSITTYMALEWAIENRFDYYDIGTCLGRPDDGLLQWKRRRGGAVDLMGNHGYFYVSLPKLDAAIFLWNSPLFAVENDQLTLHIGIPAGVLEEAVATRFREIGFSGLVRVYLHCASQPVEDLVEKLRNLYARQNQPPSFKIIIS